MKAARRWWTGVFLAPAGLLLAGCVTVGLTPDRSSDKGASAYVRGSVERLNDPQLRLDDPQELAMRLHFLAILARDEPRAWTPEDRTAVARASAPLLTYAWLPPSNSSVFARKPALLNNDGRQTGVRVRQLAMELATALPSPEFAQALSDAAQMLVSTDCPRYLLAVEANGRGWAATPQRLALAQGLLQERARLQARIRSGEPPEDAATLRCVSALEARVLREQDHAALWSAEPERRPAPYLDALQSSTRAALARALGQAAPSQPGVQAVESALRARVHLPQAAELLQTYFPWSYLQSARPPDPEAPDVHKVLSSDLTVRAVVARLLARLQSSAAAAAVPWVEWPEGGRLFNPSWVAPGGAVDFAPDLPEAFWLRYETALAQDEDTWLQNLYRGRRWEAVRRHMGEQPVTSSARWLASWGAALNTQDSRLLIKAAQALPTVPEPAVRVQGLLLLSRGALQTASLRGACPAVLLRGLGDALLASAQADDRAALLQALDHCLGRQAYEPAHRTALAGLSKLDGTVGGFRGFINARPLTWLLDASQDGALPLNLIEPAVRLRVDEFSALSPPQQQRALQVLASLGASAQPGQSLPARRLQTVFEQNVPAARPQGAGSR